MLKKSIVAGALALTALLTAVVSAPAQAQEKSPPLLNASYDVARELFAAINPKFVADWKAKTGQDLKIDQSFAGTSRQAQDIIQGKKVDTVTFNQATDINILAQRGLIRADWQKQFPNNASPYYSTIAFLVRKGNPKNIKGWDDLVRDDVKLVFPNPKTSGNARYTYLGAWLYANEKFKGDDVQTKQFVGKFLHNVVNFPTGGRGATVAFAQNGQGDVLLTFESEVMGIAKGDEFKSGGFEVIVPPVSVLAEFPVAVVDKVVDEKGTRKVATAYLNYEYSREIQLLLTTYYFRVNHPDIAKVMADRYAKVRLIEPTKVLGSWDKIEQTHFASGGVLDQLLAVRK
jgi:sulfate transport system substrate-binding protein